MSDNATPISINFLKSWTLATLYGWLLGFIGIILLVFLGDAIGLPNTQFFVGIAMGALVGYMQWRVLKKQIPIGINWAYTLGIGMGLSFILFEYGPYLWVALPEWNIHLSIITGGFLAGILQYKILKGHCKKAAWWIFYSGVGWMSVSGIILLNDTLSQMVPRGPISALIPFLMLIFATSLALGIITGLGMQKLLLSD